ncbi:MAG TPA: S-adenosylmethionine:tRNA ribosyltransferase-isomerase [Polyangiaceae bacterium]|nr:S-adenosylmethionine:tRNA ribosyltransferase-isomerase [Polyangiaceae bacterium]
MKPATVPRDDQRDQRLLHIDVERHSLSDGYLRNLPELLVPGDLLVLNDAATLPASLWLLDGSAEVRLLGRAERAGHFNALLFGAGDHHTPTEARGLPPVFQPGDTLHFASDLNARVRHVDAEEPRLIQLVFQTSEPELWRALYRAGRPVQYSYIDGTLELWHVQSRFAGRPWAVEPPSAGRPLTWQTLFELRLRGVRLTSVTHAAGLSSSGSAAIDRRLPLPEAYFVAPGAAQALAEARQTGGRIIAVGTTVVRALESAASAGAGEVQAGEGTATLRIAPGFRPRVVSGLLTGMHEPGSSHFELMRAFAHDELLERALEHAESGDYLAHEFGDSCLIA